MAAATNVNNHKHNEYKYKIFFLCTLKFLSLMALILADILSFLVIHEPRFTQIGHAILLKLLLLLIIDFDVAHKYICTNDSPAETYTKAEDAK